MLYKRLASRLFAFDSFLYSSMIFSLSFKVGCCYYTFISHCFLYLRVDPARKILKPLATNNESEDIQPNSTVKIVSLLIGKLRGGEVRTVFSEVEQCR